MKDPAREAFAAYAKAQMDYDNEIEWEYMPQEERDVWGEVAEAAIAASRDNELDGMVRRWEK